MKTLGKVLIFLVIGFFFQVVIIFIALQIEGDISGAGKGTYAIPYIMCYVSAWIIVFKRKFPKFLFDDKSENPKKEIIPDKKSEIKEIPKKEVIKQPLKNENVSSDSFEKSNFNPYPILGIIVFVLAIIIIFESAKVSNGDKIAKEMNSKSNVQEKKLESLIEDVLATKYESNGYEIKAKLSNIIKEFPNSSEAYAILGYFQSRTSDEAKAVFNLTKAINMNYKYSYDLFFWRGFSKFRLKDKIGAKTDFQKSIDTLTKIQNSRVKQWGKKDAWVEFKIGQAYVMLKRGKTNYINSLKHFKKALEIFEKDEGGSMYVEFDRSLIGKNRLMPEIIPFYKFSWRVGDFNHDVYSKIQESYRYNIYRRSSSSAIKQDFCSLMSKAGEKGYKDAYKHIKKYCN